MYAKTASCLSTPQAVAVALHRKAEVSALKLSLNLMKENCGNKQVILFVEGAVYINISEL